MTALPRRDSERAPGWFADQAVAAFPWPVEMQEAIFLDSDVAGPPTLEAVLAGLRNL